MSIRRRDFLTGTGALALLSGTSAGLATSLSWMSERRRPRKRPHIMLIIADDMRWDCFGWAGNRLIKTPALDQLAAQSLRFTDNFVTTSLDPSSRASILTGRYASTHGIWDSETPLGKNLLAVSFPLLLRQAGYYTGFIGEWGLGRPDSYPRDAFDHWESLGDESAYPRNKEHLVDQQARLAEEFLRARNDKAQPFLMVLSLKAPQAQFAPPERFLSDYKDVRIPTPATMNEAGFLSRPAMVRNYMQANTPLRDDAAFQSYIKSYYRMINAMDSSIARVLAALVESGHAEDCCVIFTADNGLLMGEFMLLGKAFGYEPCIRTPMMIRLPSGVFGTAPMGQINALTLNIDIAPTILEIADIEAPPMHGRSLLRFAYTGIPEWRKEFIYEQNHSQPGLPRCMGVRTQYYKYLDHFDTQKHEFELFNIFYDQLETLNLYFNPEYATIAQSLKRSGKSLEARIKALKTV